MCSWRAKAHCLSAEAASFDLEAYKWPSVHLRALYVPSCILRHASLDRDMSRQAPVSEVLADLRGKQAS